MLDKVVFLPAAVAGEQPLNGRILFHRVIGIDDSVLVGFHYKCTDPNSESTSRIIGLNAEEESESK